MAPKNFISKFHFHDFKFLVTILAFTLMKYLQWIPTILV